MMASPYALFRLMWRPLLPAMLFVVALAAVFPLLLLGGDDWEPFQQLWRTGGVPQVRSAAWMLVTVIPTAVGAMLATARMDVVMSGLGWALPGVRRGWQAGTLVVAVPLSIGLGWLIWRGGPPAEAVAAMGLSGFWLLVPGAWMLSELRRVTKYALGGLLIASVALASQLRLVIASVPLPMAILAVAGAVILFRHQFSAVTARKQSSQAEVLARMSLRGVHGWSAGATAEWRRPLHGGGTWRWLLAAGHEAGGGSLLRYARSVAWAALLGGVVVHLLGGTEMLPLYIGLMIGGRPLQLQHMLPYPLSRRMRAELAFGGGLVEAALIGFGMLLVLGCLSFAGFPVLAPFAHDRNSLSLPLALVAAVAWLPIMIWGSIRPMLLPGQPRQPSFVTRIGAFILYIVLTMGSTEVLRGVSFAQMAYDWRVWIIVGAGVFTYSGLWWRTRRHYATADLSPSG